MKNNMFEYRGYYGSVEYSLEDECFFGEIMGISDLVLYEGDNIQELKKIFHEAVDEYITDCENLGKAPRKEYEDSFNIIIPSDLRKEAAFAASKRGMSLNDFVQKAISSELYRI